MRRALAAALIATIALAGCGDTEDDGGGDAGPSATASVDEAASPTPSETPSQTPSEEPDDEAIEIEIEGDTITPNGKRVPVELGTTITLEVDSDRAGELHVHSTPEQELAYDKGETTLRLTIDKPGVVDVEDHHAGVVIVQLEVS